MKNIVALIGSAATNSTNHKLIEFIQAESRNVFQITVFDRLKSLPHFDPDRTLEDVPSVIVDLRNLVQNADAIIICTPEYVFSIPSGLKNMVEWFVATTVFTNKSVGLITASTNGLKAHEELQLIMHTLMATFTKETTILIQGIKGKVDARGNITDAQTRNSLLKFIESLDTLIEASLSHRS